MPSRTRTTRSIRNTAMASILASLALASTAHAGSPGNGRQTSDYRGRGSRENNQDPSKRKKEEGDDDMMYVKIGEG